MKKRAIEKKQLGIYWGQNGLYLVETAADAPRQNFFIPFEEEVKTSQLEGGVLLPWSLQLISHLQDALRQQKISASSVYLALPTKDIIFRSFILPWMQPNEMKTAVEFEARKYIPFPLEELFYCSHSILITEKGTKRLRVFFTAIKRITLENYVKILTQAGLPPQIIEPAPLSLMRPLSFKKLIHQDRCSVLVEKEETSGRIIIVNQGVPQFVREFELKHAAARIQESEDPHLMLRRFLNEVRISIDYFNRQDSRLDIKEILLLSVSGKEEIAENLNKGLDTPVTTVDIPGLLPGVAAPQMGYLKAYGAALIDPVAYPSIFDFAKNQLRLSKMQVSAAAITSGFKMVLATALACILFFTFNFIYLGRSSGQIKAREDQLTQDLGIFHDVSSAQLKERSENLKKKFAVIKNLPTKSETALFLEMIPGMLPTGIWLKDLNVSYLSGKNKFNMTIELNGYAYSENTKQQFALVNTFLINLEENKKFASFFNDIVLETVTVQKLDEFNAAFFKIRCQ